MHDSPDALSQTLPINPPRLGKAKEEKGKQDIFGFPKSLGLVHGSWHSGVSSQSLSNSARERLLVRRGEPLFFADWERVLMMHYEVDAATLQAHVPFSLDLLDGKAFVSLVAFTLRGMRPRLGGPMSAWLFKPIATHHFLNVRTYVREGVEAGIYFLAEWLSNRLSVLLGPRSFGLPYRFGHLDYDHEWERSIKGRVIDIGGGVLSYHAAFESTPDFRITERASLPQWLMDRYTAFTYRKGRRRLFRVWHLPWRQAPLEVELFDTSLLTHNWPFLADGRLIGANFSPGVTGVWMGYPHSIC